MFLYFRGNGYIAMTRLNVIQTSELTNLMGKRLLGDQGIEGCIIWKQGLEEQFWLCEVDRTGSRQDLVVGVLIVVPSF